MAITCTRCSKKAHVKKPKTVFDFLIYFILFKHNKYGIIIIIMVIFQCYFSREHIALSINKNNNSVNIELGKTNRLKALCMMQINT